MHAGGLLKDASLPKQSLSGIREVFAAKVDPLRHLFNHTFSSQVKETLVFSSTASLLGPAGQANYAAANAALDAQCSAHQKQGK